MNLFLLEASLIFALRLPLRLPSQTLSLIQKYSLAPRPIVAEDLKRRRHSPTMHKYAAAWNASYFFLFP